MRSKVLARAVVIVALAVPGWAQTNIGAAPVEAGQLVQRVVEHELADARSKQAHLMFTAVKQTPNGATTHRYVQTKDAMAGMVIAYNGIPLTAEQRQAEDARIRRFIGNPDELAKKQSKERENVHRIQAITKAMPDAFLYEYDGKAVGTNGVGKEGADLIRLKFRPNPKYEPPGRVEQMLTGMAGTVLIDAQHERMAQLEGTLMQDVGFGWGILGRLDKGGHFLLQQGMVAGDKWAPTRTDLDMTGTLLWFKKLKAKFSEVYSDHQVVASDLTYAQGVELLEKQAPVAREQGP